MSYMVCHGMKSKAGDVKNIEKHIERKNKNYKNKDIDMSRTHLNYDLHYEQYQSYKNRINERIKEEYTGKRAIRKDAIFMVNFVISSDQEFFKNLSAEKQREYFKIGYDYLKDYFGEKNVISAKVHLDETTPHMHFTAVPLIDGKLNAKKLMTRSFLRKIQSELPEILKDNGFDIERGIEGSKRKHIETEEYKRELNAQLEQVKVDITLLEKEQYALKSNISRFKRDLDIVNDISSIEARKTILGANRAISEGDYQKILSSFSKLTLEKQNTDEKNLAFEKVLESKDKDIESLKKSIDYLKQARLEDEREFKDKLKELNEFIDSNFEDIRTKTYEKVRNEYNDLLYKTNSNLTEVKKELKEIKNTNENYEMANNFLRKRMDLLKRFLNTIGESENANSFIENEIQRERKKEKEKHYSKSYFYDNYFNKNKEKDYEMEL